MAKQPGKPKSTATAPTKPDEPVGFTNLTTWQRVPLDEAEEFDFMAATNDSVGYEDCFGDDPEHLMVHRGPVQVAGEVVLDGWKAAKNAQQTVYIIDGDLHVDGPVIFDQPDIQTTLWVTGNLTTTRLACMSTAMLIVGGALTVTDLLVTDLEDAGHLIVHGSLTAPTWIDLTHGRGCIELAHAPQTRFLSDHYADPDNAADDDDDEADDDEPTTHRPRSFPVAPATPALASTLIKDEQPDRRKLLAALRSGAKLLA